MLVQFRESQKAFNILIPLPIIFFFLYGFFSLFKIMNHFAEYVWRWSETTKEVVYVIGFGSLCLLFYLILVNPNTSIAANKGKIRVKSPGLLLATAFTVFGFWWCLHLTWEDFRAFDRKDNSVTVNTRKLCDWHLKQHIRAWESPETPKYTFKEEGDFSGIDYYKKGWDFILANTRSGGAYGQFYYAYEEIEVDEDYGPEPTGRVIEVYQTLKNGLFTSKMVEKELNSSMRQGHTAIDAETTITTDTVTISPTEVRLLDDPFAPANSILYHIKEGHIVSHEDLLFWGTRRNVSKRACKTVFWSGLSFLK